MIQEWAPVPISFKQSSNWEWPINNEDLGEFFSQIITNNVSAFVFNQFSSSKNETMISTLSREHKNNDLFCAALRCATKLRTLGFGILEPQLFVWVVNACSENKNLEDVSFTVTDCTQLSKTVDVFHTAK